MVMSALLGLAWVSMFRGEFAAARAAVSESRAARHESEAEAASVRLVEPVARWILGWMELAGGNAAQASESLAAVVGVFRSSIVARYASVPLVVLAQAQLALGGS